MNYTLVTIPTARKSLKKLPPQVKTTLVEALQKLITEPYLGEILTGEFSQLRSHHLKLNNVHYRVVYHVQEERHQIVIIYADTRENFYRDLRKLNIKQLVKSL